MLFERKNQLPTLRDSDLVRQPAEEICGGDETLASLHAEPFRVIIPEIQSSPFVFSSPHSGNLYPSGFTRQSRLSASNLRRSEDAFVDKLFLSAPDIGAPLIAARFPRAFVDVNRAPGELDPSMFDGPLPLPCDGAGPRVSAGLGVIPRIVRDGAEIYRQRLPASEAELRITRFHRPYHAALAGLVDATHRRFGAAILVDCHSMPSAAAAPDIILGDRYGLSAAPLVTRAFERAFEHQGFHVMRNVPYAGGYTTQLYGHPSRNVHAIQVEINRGLYLDEERIEPTAGFSEIARRIAASLTELGRLGDLLIRPIHQHAAE